VLGTLFQQSIRLEPSKRHIGLRRWQQPYSWLTGTAISILIFSLIITVGFVRGYLNTAVIYFEWYSSGAASGIPNAVIIISVSAIIPVIVSVAGATILLGTSKIKLGTHLTLAAIATVVIMDAVFIGYLWDGQHVIQSYTHAEWLIRAFNEYGDYSAAVYVFYLAYVPLLVGMSLSLLYGSQRLKPLK
jgi:hypothetical protein